MTKKGRMTGVATLVVMVLFGASWLSADEPNEVFRQLKNTMEAFKVCNSEVIKEWPDEATSDEALNQLATDLCEREEIRDKNVFTIRSKTNGKDRIEGITILSNQKNGAPMVFFNSAIGSIVKDIGFFGIAYMVDAVYTNGVWSFHILKHELRPPPNPIPEYF